MKTDHPNVLPRLQTGSSVQADVPVADRNHVPETRYQAECRALEQHLQPLVGKTVKELVRETNSEADFGQPVYGLHFTDGTVAWIMQDPEGNGPGHLNIELPEAAG